MNTALVWDNVVAYSLQIGLLVGVASLVPALLRLVLPKARLAYWHVLLAACLVLPLARPWKQAIVTVTTPAAPAMSPVTSSEAAPRTQTHWSPGEIGLLLLAAGAIGRLGWLAVGLWRLRRYRKHSTHWRGPAVAFGPRPEYRLSDDIGSPVTFGLFQPVVLLPGNFQELRPAMQDAVLCHEAVHVERRDWAFTVAEELVRAVFWFHPAIWWLLGEIQLAREQAVDREVVDRTQARDEYVDALLAVAGAKVKLEMDLAPAPLFLRRRHLKQRVIAVVQEVRMSRMRLISTLTAGLATMAAVCWLAAAAFPLAAEPQVVADGPGVTVEMNGAQLLHRTPVRYPADMAAKNVQGTVVAQVRLGSDGSVVDATIVSGPDELRKPVLAAVLNWHFAKNLAGATQTVSVSFQVTPEELKQRTLIGQSQLHQAESAPAEPAASASVIKSIRVQGLSDQARTDLLASLPAHEGDAFTQDLLARTQAAATAFDEHLRVIHGKSADGTVALTILPTDTSAMGMITTLTGTLGTGTQGSFTTTLPAPPKPQVDLSMSVAMPKTVQIGSNVQAAQLLYGPKPVYPPLAKQARVSGVVHLHAIIGTDGSVQALAVIAPAHPLLAPAAMEAVRQWKYKPTLLNGEAVAVDTTIDVSFMLADEQQQQ